MGGIAHSGRFLANAARAMDERWPAAFQFQLERRAGLAGLEGKCLTGLEGNAPVLYPGQPVFRSALHCETRPPESPAFQPLIKVKPLSGDISEGKMPQRQMIHHPA